MIDKIAFFIQENIFWIFFITLLFSLLIWQTFYFRNKLNTIRKDSLKRSKSIKKGQMTEQFAPYLPEFPCNPYDAKFIGKPVDFICFKGLEEKDEVDEIVFVEIKTGESQLSSREQSIKQAIIDGRIKYLILNYKS